MPKIKERSKQDKKEYFLLAIGIFLAIFCFLLLARIGSLEVVYLFISFIFGDFTSLAIIFILIYAIMNLIINKPIDLHHIYTIGVSLIYLGLSMLCHVGIYDELDMNNTNILAKTFDLYSHYLKAYDNSYSVGGGIIAALVCQIIGLVSGKLGISLFGISLIIVGVSYLVDINILSIFKRGNLKRRITGLFSRIKAFVTGINVPTKNKVVITPLMLKDVEDNPSFTLQNEVNTEMFNNLKKYIDENRVNAIVKTFNTSYTSSRFIVVLPHKSEYAINELSQFFKRNCFFIQNDLELYIDTTNQFKKLFTLKNMLKQDTNDLSLGLEVDGRPITLNNEGRGILVCGDEGSGIKTFIRSLLVSLFIKRVPLENIFFYDLNMEFKDLERTDIKYMNNENSASIAFEEAFSEYERRMETLNYLKVRGINEANEILLENGSRPILPIYHFIIIRNSLFNEALFQKLQYVLQFGIKTGMIIFLFIREHQVLYRINANSLDILSFRINDTCDSVKLFGSDIASRLQKKGDFIYERRGTLLHGQAPYISIDDFDDIIAKL